MQVDVTGGTPTGEVAFVTGGAGDTYTPIPRGICESVGVPLSFPSLRAKRTADSSGNLSVSFGGFLVCGTGVVVVDMTTWQCTLP